jgi:hypothetical protein
VVWRELRVRCTLPEQDGGTQLHGLARDEQTTRHADVTALEGCGTPAIAGHARPRRLVGAHGTTRRSTASRAAEARQARSAWASTHLSGRRPGFARLPAMARWSPHRLAVRLELSELSPQAQPPDVDPDRVSVALPLLVRSSVADAGDGTGFVRSRP